MISTENSSIRSKIKTRSSNVLSHQNESDLGKYFKDSISLSKNLSKSRNNLSNTHDNTKRIQMRNESDLGKYFKDSITLSENKFNNQFNKNMILEFSESNKKHSENYIEIEKLNKDNISSESVEDENCHLKNINFNQNNKSKLLLYDGNNSKHLKENIKGNISNSSDISHCKDKTSTIISTNNNSNSSTEVSSQICTQDQCKLASWGLPPIILQKYEAKGISQMFPWQVECLSNCKVIQGRKNILYSAPTSAGKTLVAEILLLKAVLEYKKKAIFVLPFVSVVREKMYYFKDLLSECGIKVEGFMGGVTPPGGFTATDIAIATIEKANSIINRLMEEGDLSTLGAIVIDELHLLGDPNRGYLLELLLTKLRYMSLRETSINVQLIGMSATLPNLTLLAEWLDAELYKTEFRPIPLQEQCKIGKSIYDNEMKLHRNLVSLSELPMDTDNILQLCMETISDGNSILIFCPTKNWCEKLTYQIATTFCKLGQKNTTLGSILKEQLNDTAILETIEQLKRCPCGLDNTLKNIISFGVAFHHAGLTIDERDVIEGAFRSGSLRVLVATSTLSSGVNLPARRVIIRSPMFGGKVLDTLTYKQMIGRAGRMGRDTAGESILICKPNERKAAECLLSATLKPIESCLKDSNPLIRTLLEAVASEVVYTQADLELYMNCTLASINKKDIMINLSTEAIKYLTDNEFLLLQTTEQEERWVATPLGKACLAASISPIEGLFLFEELQRARRCFVLDTELHVVYLVTPVNGGSQIGTIDWMVFMELWKSMSESEKRVGQLIGVEERFLMSAIRGVVKPGKPLRIHQRFYTALALHDLVREIPLNTVCNKYNCCRGVLQSLQQSASTFAGMVTQFCKQLGWDCMELLIGQFKTRLQFGVCRELLDLLRISMLNGLRARSLYKQGITTIADLAVANILDVERALYKALPFESEKEHDGEHELEAITRNKMRTVFVTGKDGLTPHEAATLLVKEARILIQNELGLQNMSWSHNNCTVTDTTCNSNNQSNVSKDIILENDNIDSNIDYLNASERKMNDVDKNDKNFSRIDSTGNISMKDSIPIEHNNIIEQNSNIDATNVIDKNPENKSRYSKDLNDTTINFIENNIPEIIDSTEHKRDSESSITPKISRKRIHEEKNIDDINLLKYCKNNNINESEMNMKFSVPRSPSLFDESLNLDTQMYNVLEENIIDSLHFSSYVSINAETKNEINMKNQKELLNHEVENNLPMVKLKSNANNMSQKVSSHGTEVEDKSVMITWNDDSWNESKLLLNKINELDTENIEVINNSINNMKNIKNVSQNCDIQISSLQVNNKNDIESKSCDRLCEQDTNKISCKYNLRKFSDKGPFIINKTTSNLDNKISLDSNKSDLDVITSSPKEMISAQKRLKLKKTTKIPMKVYKDKLSKLEPSVVINKNKIEISNSNINKDKPKLRQLLERNILLNANYSTDSIISNSDEDTPIKKAKIIKGPKTTLPIIKTSSFHNKQIQSDVQINLYVNKVEHFNENIDWNTLNIVKVGSDKATFNLFKREVMKNTSIALALHCESYVNESNNIGNKIVSSTTEGKNKSRKSEQLINGDKKICGAAISWEKNIAYYISFCEMKDLKVSIKEQINFFKELLSNTSLYIRCFSTKKLYKTLYQCFQVAATCRFLDPYTADWLLHGSISEKKWNEMVLEYFPSGSFIIKYFDTDTNVRNKLPFEFKASAKVVLTWHVMDTLLSKLEELCPVLIYTFKEIEMRTITLLARMELTGFGIHLKSLQELSRVIEGEMFSLKERAYSLAGRKFNFSSSKEVSQVLGLYKEKKKISTNKAVLEQYNNPISSLVISWRKLNATQTKIVHPILCLAQNNPRIHGNSETSTLTGRITMHEPNLQNVPKDFNSENNSFVISVRMAFIPFEGNVLLSADYCQLELRILAHFSKDPILCNILCKEGDIFKNIAAAWNNISEDKIDDNMRQNTKQLCYGMIYGMGVKTLAENLKVTETEAKAFLESFINAYPGVHKWLKDINIEAHKNGYITTLMERRRMLPGLQSTNLYEKAQAERQAVNTKVQGSAADIAKQAMVNIEDRIRNEFPNSAIIIPETKFKQKLRKQRKDDRLRGAYLVLQLHDELLYEVNIMDLQQVALIVKESMEQVCQLAVPLPVKIKVGPAWGDLKEYHI
ncbi:DNA polymerase theta [Vespa crabro]|uniref:DNA polymerase theta n=1 Tax=Vespa crabro TaxID=7445 RepID=UPI001EFF9796|nr:DNA polymerase theta [Vespa crabro]